MKSIMTNDTKKCWLCPTDNRVCIEEHHAIGGANRKHSDKYGLTIGLCRKHHRMAHLKVDLGIQIKIAAQMAFEREHGDRKAFVKIFGRNWLGGDE